MDQWIKSNKVSSTLILIFLFAFLVYVWPTPYRNFQSGDRQARVNRFTGSVEVLSRDGWR